MTYSVWVASPLAPTRLVCKVRFGVTDGAGVARCEVWCLVRLADDAACFRSQRLCLGGPLTLGGGYPDASRRRWPAAIVVKDLGLAGGG